MTDVKRTVLVVDDDPILCREVAEFLGQDEQWWIDTALSAGEALTKIRRVAEAGTAPVYDVMVLDLLMEEGEMTGFEFLERLRKEGAIFDQLYIIVFSGYLNGDRIQTALDLGAEDFVRKRDLYDELIPRVTLGMRRQAEKLGPTAGGRGSASAQEESNG